MVVLIVCASVPDFYYKALELIKSGQQSLEFLDFNEIRTTKTRYLRICTGSEILSASRIYSDIDIILLPCYRYLPDKNNIDRALTQLKIQKSYIN